MRKLSLPVSDPAGVGACLLQPSMNNSANLFPATLSSISAPSHRIPSHKWPSSGKPAASWQGHGCPPGFQGSHKLHVGGHGSLSPPCASGLHCLPHLREAEVWGGDVSGATTNFTLSRHPHLAPKRTPPATASCQVSRKVRQNEGVSGWQETPGGRAGCGVSRKMQSTCHQVACGPEMS